MSARNVTLLDKDNNPAYPQTKADAVYNDYSEPLSTVTHRQAEADSPFSVVGYSIRQATGVVWAASGFCITPLIPVTEGEVIKVGGYSGGSTYIVHSLICAYDSDKQFVASYGNSAEGYAEYELTVPSGVSYIRVGSRENNEEVNYRDRSYVQFAVGRLFSCIEKAEQTSAALQTTISDMESREYVETDFSLAIYLVERDGYWRADSGTWSLESGYKRTSLIPINLYDRIESNSTYTSPYGTVGNLTFDEDGVRVGNLPFTNGHAVITQELWEAGVRYICMNWKLADTPTPTMKIYRQAAQAMQDIIESQPGIVSKLSRLYNNSKWAFKGIAPESFQRKMLASEKDITIALLGDSMTAITNIGAEFPNAANLPPGCQHNAITYQLWNILAKNKPQCDRFDSATNTISESGTFTDSSYSAQCTPNTHGEFSPDNCVYRETSTALDSISFTWDLDDYEKLQFIGRMAIDGSKVITVTCDSGKVVVVHNNKANPKEGYEDGQLVEANGYTFTQYLAGVNNYHAKWVRNFPIEFRRVAGATGAVTITLTNTTDGTTSKFYYWGTERWNYTTVHIVNLGRGGRNIPALNYNLAEDLGYRNIDLLIFQLPLWNELKAGGDIVPTINSRIDNIVDTTIRAISDNFTKYPLILTMYHTQAASWSGNNSIPFQSNGTPDRPKTTYPDWTCCSQVFNHVLSLCEENVVAANLYNEVFNFAYANGVTMQNLLSAINENTSETDGTSYDTESFTTDGTHLSSSGFDFYVQLIAEMLYK